MIQILGKLRIKNTPPYAILFLFIKSEYLFSAQGFKVDIKLSTDKKYSITKHNTVHDFLNLHEDFLFLLLAISYSPQKEEKVQTVHKCSQIGDRHLTLLLLHKHSVFLVFSFLKN